MRHFNYSGSVINEYVFEDFKVAEYPRLKLRSLITHLFPIFWVHPEPFTRMLRWAARRSVASSPLCLF